MENSDYGSYDIFRLSRLERGRLFRQEKSGHNWGSSTWGPTKFADPPVA